MQEVKRKIIQIALASASQSALPRPAWHPLSLYALRNDGTVWFREMNKTVNEMPNGAEYVWRPVGEIPQPETPALP